MNGNLWVERLESGRPGERSDLGPESGLSGKQGGGPGEHPAAEVLQRFVAGKATREEAKRVVRHLLKGCAACRLVAARLWCLGELPASRQRERRGLRLVRGER